MRQGIDEEHIQRGTADVMEGSPSVFDVHSAFFIVLHLQKGLKLSLLSPHTLTKRPCCPCTEKHISKNGGLRAEQYENTSGDGLTV